MKMNKLFNFLKSTTLLLFLFSHTAVAETSDATGAATTTTPVPSGSSDVSIPLRYFEQSPDGVVNHRAREEFVQLYNKFKDNEELKGSEVALQRVLAFYAKNKDGIPRSCGGDLDATSSPRGEKLDAVNKIDNQDFILLVDYTKPHVADRFFILDMKSGKVESCPVAHGYGSNSNCPPEHQVRCNGKIKCKITSEVNNRSGGGATSRGFYLTDEGYRSSQNTFNSGSPRSSGHNALNLRGLLGGVNDKALDRSVVFHRASYAENMCSSSAGCPAICPQLFEDYKDKVKRSLMYVHTPEDEEKPQPDC